MTVTVNSTVRLADAVAAHPKAPAGVVIAPVAELTGAFAPCDAVELLGWMGWMTAGPLEQGEGLAGK